MKNIPRILPLVGVAMGGVLAVNALAGAQGLPDLLDGARALAEEATGAGEKAAPVSEAAESAETAAVDAAASVRPAKPPAPVCAPTAAELAKAAGLSPAELQVLQSLGDRRGQLDQREKDLDVQIALMAAAEGKVDAKLKQLAALKGEVQGLLNQADAQEQAEVDRLVKVFEGMKAKDAAARMAVLDDGVRLPIAAKMKERSLSAVLAAMPAGEAKKLTESLAKRFADVKAKAAEAGAQAQPQAAAPAPKTAAAPPAQPAAKAG